MKDGRRILHKHVEYTVSPAKALMQQLIHNLATMELPSNEICLGFGGSSFVQNWGQAKRRSPDSSKRATLGLQN